jgi:hypothetical protein
MDRPKLISPFTAMLSGATMSGKSFFVARCLDHLSDMIAPVPERIVLCYGAWQSGYATLGQSSGRTVELYEGLQNITFDPSINNDLMDEASKTVSKYFTKYSHHQNCSIMYLVQNLFHQSPEHRTISLNSQYMILFANPRDSSQIRHLAKQVLPGCPRALEQAYIDATSKAYGYLLLDFKPQTPAAFRLRTDIFPGQTTIVYIPKLGCKKQ